MQIAKHDDTCMYCRGVTQASCAWATSTQKLPAAAIGSVLVQVAEQFLPSGCYMPPPPLAPPPLGPGGMTYKPGRPFNSQNVTTSLVQPIPSALHTLQSCASCGQLPDFKSPCRTLPCVEGSIFSGAVENSVMQREIPF